ncbi:AMP-binding protein, partial [Saccharopolyspora sp. NPDC049426]|uniref:AMP-binding protein n=1 Tax=Saccharopolyspora sp. NPDC049426 TaxID=3155652 RepID=UPI0034142E03
MPAVELSYASGVSDVPLLGDTIGENLDRTAARFPDRDALVEVATGRRWTYREFLAEVDVVAAGLLEAGVVKGDRVGIWGPNRAEWTLTQYATARIGAILVNINPAYRSHELEFVLNQAGVRMLVSAKSFKSSDYVAIVDEVRGRCAALEEVVYFDDPSWQRLLDSGRAADRERVRSAQSALSSDDAINIQYTSGTTGFPKGATLSHHNILNNGFFVGELCGYSEVDRVAIVPPFYHCFGMVMGNLA